MTGSDIDRETADMANELYWNSDRSVNKIADEMDLSKGTLYGMILPWQSGLSCPACTQEVVYANRTMKEKGQVSCPSCGWEGSEDDTAVEGAGGSVTVPVSGEDDVPAPPPSRWADSTNRTIAGGALLGAAAGLALVFWARRR
jgi:hypothetical protein